MATGNEAEMFEFPWHCADEEGFVGMLESIDCVRP